MLLRVALLVFLGVLTAGSVTAARAENKPRFKPAIVYLYAGSDSDHSFIDAARSGLERAKHDFATDIAEFRARNGDDVTASLKRAADAGFSPIIALGGQNVVPVLNLAEHYPNTRFTVIDGLVPPLFANVQSIVFKDHEGAFLVGMIAARMSKSGRIGFIGGMDTPLIRNFLQGYIQGAHYARAQIQVDTDMIGNSADAWSNPAAGYQLASKQFEAGADVIFAAAGGSGQGVLEAAEHAGKYAIGADANQNGLYPGHVLTSLVKRVDIAVYDTLRNSSKGDWSPGIKSLGIREGALDYAVDDHNRTLINGQMIEDVSMAKELIGNGSLSVESYSAN